MLANFVDEKLNHICHQSLSLEKSTACDEGFSNSWIACTPDSGKHFTKIQANNGGKGKRQEPISVPKHQIGEENNATKSIPGAHKLATVSQKM